VWLLNCKVVNKTVLHNWKSLASSSLSSRLYNTHHTQLEIPCIIIIIIIITALQHITHSWKSLASSSSSSRPYNTHHTLLEIPWKCHQADKRKQKMTCTEEVKYSLVFFGNPGPIATVRVLPDALSCAMSPLEPTNFNTLVPPLL